MREPRHAPHVRVRAQHRDGPHHLDRQRGRVREPDEQAACHGARAELADPFGVTGRGWDFTLADLAHQLAHEKGVALGRGEAGVHEGLVGLVARLFAQQRLERGSAERSRPHEPCAGVSEQLLEQLLLDLLGTRPARHGQRHRQVLHAAGEVGEEGQ